MKKYFLEIYFPIGIVIGSFLALFSGISLFMAMLMSVLFVMLAHLSINKRARQMALFQLKNIFSSTKKDF
ncbi:hypothetical protein NPE20_10710 [Mucilaginibacter sp. JC4]|uniref:DUF4133 domain-containing protein n=1 Tax=Mucilaginibacter aquariorum TaxID=2967225 RepID=A0ABT1T1H6_9SPHI|nr:hypothetical protein [Mucilaginibacter aquariorum]